jgi:bZIP transcription factor
MSDHFIDSVFDDTYGIQCVESSYLSGVFESSALPVFSVLPQRSTSQEAAQRKAVDLLNCAGSGTSIPSHTSGMHTSSAHVQLSAADPLPLQWQEFSDSNSLSSAQPVSSAGSECTSPLSFDGTINFGSPGSPVPFHSEHGPDAHRPTLVSANAMFSSHVEQLTDSVDVVPVHSRSTSGASTDCVDAKMNCSTQVSPNSSPSVSPILSPPVSDFTYQGTVSSTSTTPSCVKQEPTSRKSTRTRRPNSLRSDSDSSASSSTTTTTTTTSTATTRKRKPTTMRFAEMFPDDEEEDLSHLSKRERNKISAAKYRKKRKMYVSVLENKLDDLSGQLQDLADENSSLREKLAYFTGLAKNNGKPIMFAFMFMLVVPLALFAGAPAGLSMGLGSSSMSASHATTRVGGGRMLLNCVGAACDAPPSQDTMSISAYDDIVDGPTSPAKLDIDDNAFDFNETAHELGLGVPVPTAYSVRQQVQQLAAVSA